MRSALSISDRTRASAKFSGNKEMGDESSLFICQWIASIVSVGTILTQAARQK